MQHDPAGDAGLATVRRLIAGGPMPLAQLAQRARNSKSAEAVFQNARCLGEATAALGAAFWLGRARQAGAALSPRLREALASLLRRGSAFGTWVGLLREGATAAGGDALSRLLRPLDDLEPVERLAEAMEPLLAAGGPFGADAEGLRGSLRRASGEGMLGFLDFLVVLRNRVHGHGAVPPEAVCRKRGGSATS